MNEPFVMTTLLYGASVRSASVTQVENAPEPAPSTLNGRRALEVVLLIATITSFEPFVKAVT